MFRLEFRLGPNFSFSSANMSRIDCEVIGRALLRTHGIHSRIMGVESGEAYSEI